MSAELPHHPITLDTFARTYFESPNSPEVTDLNPEQYRSVRKELLVGYAEEDVDFSFPRLMLALDLKQLERRSDQDFQDEALFNEYKVVHNEMADFTNVVATARELKIPVVATPNEVGSLRKCIDLIVRDMLDVLNEDQKKGLLENLENFYAQVSERSTFKVEESEKAVYTNLKRLAEGGRTSALVRVLVNAEKLKIAKYQEDSDDDTEYVDGGAYKLLLRTVNALSSKGINLRNEALSTSFIELIKNVPEGVDFKELVRTIIPLLEDIDFTQGINEEDKRKLYRVLSKII